MSSSSELLPLQRGLSGAWISFREIWFDSTRVGIQPSDEDKIADVARLLRRNPQHCVAIDGAVRDRASDAGGQRVGNVRDALLRAGVPAERILTDDIGHAGLRHADRVELLVGMR
jgi:outer membrane protein OmpA-like peptidoglycan-associated protein